MKSETKIISAILISTAFLMALTAGLTLTLISVDQGKEMNTKQYTLSGKVLNAQSQAVAYARVTILGDSNFIETNGLRPMNDEPVSKTVITDVNGKFKIKNISSGTYTHKVEADGYKTLEQQVTITEDKSIIITLETS